MRFWTPLFAAMALACGSVRGEPGFFAQVNAGATNVFLGQVFTVDVIVKAPEKPAAPELEGLGDFKAVLLEDGRATKGTNTWFYRFAFRAKREGELSIPSLRFGMVATEPIAIRAEKPVPTDRMTLETRLSASSVYLGEPVVLTTTWDSTFQLGALKAVDFNFPILNDPRFEILEPYEPEKEKDALATGLPVHGTRVLATRKSYEVGDVRHQSLTFEKILLPRKTGKLAIPPGTLLCAAEKEVDAKSTRGQRIAFQYPAYFDNTFFDQNLSGGDYARIYTESAPLELDVKPLPVDGRPALFTGMVGDYTIAAAAEPTTVLVGEPVTLTITITANAFMENISFLPLRYQPNLVNRFDIPAERSLPQLGAKWKIYTQTIRPLSTDIASVPPIQLAFFSPASNAYITVESLPIPLQVSPAEPVAAYGMAGAPYRTRLRAVKDGIRQNHENPEMLHDRRRPFFGGAQPTLVFTILLLPPLLVGGTRLVSLFGEKKHHIQRTAKAARAYKVYRKNAAHIIRGHQMEREIYVDLDQVLRAYLGDRLHLNPGALSFREVENALTGADERTVKELKTLFAVCETYRFTAGFDAAADARKIIHEATRIVKTLEGSLK